jgi:hypothetical protein
VKKVLDEDAACKSRNFTDFSVDEVMAAVPEFEVPNEAKKKKPEMTLKNIRPRFQRESKVMAKGCTRKYIYTNLSKLSTGRSYYQYFRWSSSCNVPSGKKHSSKRKKTT